MSGSASDAKFFYGQVNASKNSSATGVKAGILNPERVFEMNSNSKTTGELSNTDSGISYYWDVTLEPNESKNYAVILTVLGAEKSNAEESIKGDVNNYVDVTPDIIVPVNQKIFFDDDINAGNDDTLAQTNHFDTLKNFLLLGVQKKLDEGDEEESTNMRFVSVADSRLLKNADEYGYLIAKTSTGNMTYTDARARINQLQYGAANVKAVPCTKTSNQISGKYGIYHNDLEDTSHEHYSPYKYVTLGIDNVPSDQIIMARFYIRKN